MKDLSDPGGNDDALASEEFDIVLRVPTIRGHDGRHLHAEQRADFRQRVSRSNFISSCRTSSTTL